MYVPEHFRGDAGEAARALIAAHPFATVIVVDARGEPIVNHLPVVIERCAAGDRLVWHAARRNPLWREIQRASAVTLVFHGAHAYVSPTWYAEHDVPTWNYAVVHVRGEARLVEEHEELLAILKASTRAFEGEGKEPGTWAFDLPADLAEPRLLRAAIVGFQLPLAGARIECKLKLSQNRSEADRRGAIAGLEARGDEASVSMARMMAEAMRG